MKHLLLCIFYAILLNFSNIHAHEKIRNNNPSPEQSTSKLSWYYNYFIVKELYNLITSPALLNNPKKWDDASIACCKCHQLASSGKLWDYFMAYTQEPLLKELMFTVNNGTTEELSLFNLQKHQEFEIRCDHCFTHSGWYIPGPKPSSDK